MVEEVQMRGIMYIPYLLKIAVILELLVSLYMSRRLLSNMREDIEYSSTRIFLSDKSLVGIKVMLSSLMYFAFANVLALILAEGVLMEIVLWFNYVVLFGGLLYFLRNVALVTGKS